MISTESVPVSTSACPRCRKRGYDKHGDNLTIYSDGHSFCFKCRHYGHISSSLAFIKSRLDISINPNKDQFIHGFNPESGTHELPIKVLQWLEKYGITSEERRVNDFWWDIKTEHLYIPIYKDRKLIHTTARYFGNKPNHPKYIITGKKTKHFHIFRQPQTRILILVEDIISAIKVGRQFNCIPLLGTFAAMTLILQLAKENYIVKFWLDRNAADQAIKQTERARQFISDCGTIITDKDPKEYSDKEIHDIVLFTTESFS